MTYSIAHYTKLCETTLSKNASLSQETRHLMAIKALMSAYQQKSQRFFSSLHHVASVDKILKLSNNCLDMAEGRRNLYGYKIAIPKILDVIQDTINDPDFNAQGDFANIYEALIKCEILTKLEPVKRAKVKKPIEDERKALKSDDDYSTVFTPLFISDYIPTYTPAFHHHHHHHHHNNQQQQESGHHTHHHTSHHGSSHGFGHHGFSGHRH